MADNEDSFVSISRIADTAKILKKTYLTGRV